MKKLLLLLTIIAFASCKKYEDNPDGYVTFASTEKRLCREWIQNINDSNYVIWAFSKDRNADYLFHVQTRVHREIESNNQKLIYDNIQNGTFRFYDKNYIYCDFPEYKYFDLEWNNIANSIDTTFTLMEKRTSKIKILRLTKKEFWWREDNTEFENKYKAK